MYHDYCRSRTRGRIVRFFLGILLVLLGLVLFVTFFIYLYTEGARDADYYVSLAVSLGLGIGFLVCGLYQGYIGIRDCLRPEKSHLAKSIRAQLRHPEEAPDWQRLFDMVDRDIELYGQWFERLAIGKEWVLGDDVSYIPNIRGVFGRDETVVRHHNGRTQSSRIIQLYIVDYRQQVQISGFTRPAELESSLRCLRLKAPEVYFGPYKEFTQFCAMSEEKWDDMERQFTRRRSKRQSEQEKQQREQDINNSGFVLSDAHGQRSSRISETIIREHLKQLAQPDSHFELLPIEPIEDGLRGRLAQISCRGYQEGVQITLLFQPKQGPLDGWRLTVGEREAESTLLGLVRRKKVPDLYGWEHFHYNRGKN